MSGISAAGEWWRQKAHRWDRRALGGTSEEDDALSGTWPMCQSHCGPAKGKVRTERLQSRSQLTKRTEIRPAWLGESKRVLGHTGNGWIAPRGDGREFGLYVIALRSQERRQQGWCELINIKEHLLQCLMIVQCSASSLIIGIFYYSYIVSSSVHGLYGTLWHRLSKVC